MPEAALRASRTWGRLRRVLDRAFPDPLRGVRTPRRPPSLVYGLDDAVPPSSLLLLAAQHAMLAVTFLIYPILAAAEAGLPADQTFAMVSACAMSMGIATVIQCLRSRVGSGYLAVHIPSASSIPLAVQALTLGGPGLLASMIMLLGVCQLFVARLARRLRVLLPPEVCGVAVVLLGVSLAGPALRRALGLDHGTSVDAHSLGAGFATVAVLVGITVFAPRRLKLFAVFAGAVVGWGLAAVLGAGQHGAAEAIAHAPLLALPTLTLPSFQVMPSLFPLVGLLVLINLMDVLSVTISLERMNDADWRRADMHAAQRAVTTCGIGNILNGFTSGFQSGLSSSSVGLAFATQSTARIIGVVAGVMIFAIAFMPKAILTLTFIPSPVIGGILLYTSAYLVVAGMDLVTSRRLSERRVFLVGLSVVAGLSVALLPIREQLPVVLQPLFSTPLTVGAITAVLLNLLFRIGISQETGEIVPGNAPAFTVAQDFLERQGDLWGARRDVIAAAIPTVAQALELVADSGIAEGPLELRARFDEAHLDVYLLYDGEVVEAPKERPSPEALLGDAKEQASFAAWMLKRLSDHVHFGRTAGGKARILLRFDH